MLTETFVEKYTPKHVNDLPYDNKFISILQNFININLIQVIFVSDDSFSKNCVVNSIINTMNLAPKDIMFLSNFKDQGVSNIRSEVKLFSQIAKSHHNKKRMLIIEDIETYSDNIQKLFIKNLPSLFNKDGFHTLPGYLVQSALFGIAFYSLNSLSNRLSVL